MTAAVGSDPIARLATLPGVTDAVAAARTSVDTLLRHRVMRRDSARVTAEASLRTARASAALDGHDIALDDLRAHLGHDLRPATAADGSGSFRTALGAVRLYAELGTLRDTWEHAPRQALARMHVLVARGLIADADLGRPRVATWPDPGAASAAMDDPLGSPAGPVGPLGLGPAPTPAEATARLDGLTALLMARTAAPAIIVAAIVEGELLAIRPFGGFDGIIARAAGRLVLISRGLDPKAVTATDVGHIEAGRIDGHRTYANTYAKAYADAVHAYTRADTHGVGAWIMHYAQAVELGARESLAICEAIARAD
ncbi:hypothetical protein [Frankia sp. CiP3]|uniref:hypothetical protein n=1 Tax=Frankia sp. CiP3 TaxID=2880971 RepID=UPI001EF4265C|nr:hypothetical protein [Frankia sp. CiP3]